MSFSSHVTLSTLLTMPKDTCFLTVPPCVVRLVMRLCKLQREYSNDFGGGCDDGVGKKPFFYNTRLRSRAIVMRTGVSMIFICSMRKPMVIALWMLGERMRNSICAFSLPPTPSLFPT